MMNQISAIQERTSGLPPSSRRPSLASLPDLGEPREWSVLGRYLQDPSLRYMKVGFAGPTLGKLLALALVFLAGLVAAFLPLIQLISQPAWNPVLLLVPFGVILCLELSVPMFWAWAEFRNRLHFVRTFRTADLGLDRAVPQPATSVRYEVHVAPRKGAEIDGILVRLVFWESWREKKRLRWLRIPYWTTERQGHDLVRQELMSIKALPGQHVLLRGAIRIPPVRPTEHHRGKRKHLAYVNITITLVSSGKVAGVLRGNCPHLITFPWM